MPDACDESPQRYLVLFYVTERHASQVLALCRACFGTEEEALLVEIVTHSYGAPLIAFAPLSLLASRSDKVNPCQIVTRDLDLDSWSCELSFTLKNGH